MTKSGVKIKAPIILMAWPIAGLLLAFLLYAIVNFALASSGLSGGDGLVATIVNVVLFVVAFGSIVLGIPSFVVGVILLILRLANKPSHAIGLGIAGMVLGIVSILTSFVFVGVALGVVGICLSASAIKRSTSKKGMAITGLITSIVGVAISVIVSLILLTVVAYAGVSDAAKSTNVKNQAVQVSGIVVDYYDNHGTYPSYKDLMSELIDNQAISSEVVDNVGAYGSVKNVEYIPCYGDGGMVWYWDFEASKYNSFEYGDTSNCQY